MSLKKLTDTDKEQILTLYRQTAATSSTLAERFGVSNSTISRLLKTHLGEREYEDLIQQKRLTRFQKRDSQPPLPLEVETAAVPPAQPSLAETESPAPSRSRRRRSSAASAEAEPEILAPSPPAERFTLPAPQKRTPRPAPASPPPLPQDSDLGEIVKDLDDDFEDEELDEELEEEDSEDLDEDWGEEEADFAPALAEVVNVQVLPFTSAVLPPSCYLVVDRVAELIVRPLREFAHLGMIPTQEDQQKTLPVFDNHRIARRFSNRTQRVIKVPDSRLLQKTLPQLRDKGITRIFLDGQVYSLDGGG
ncbi:MAG: transposase [Cyanobacteria bacterium RI_101]|nr:transposase [Cyanobacteria bacterium RI_101]